MGDFFQTLMKIIFPPRCICCGEIMEVSSEIELCGRCLGEIGFSPEILPVLEYGYRNLHYCDGVLCLCGYRGILRHSIVRFKYYNKPSYHRAFARLLCRGIALLPGTGAFDMAIGVPAYKERERERGYNQACLLANAFCRETGLPDCSGLLSRIRDTGNQSRLDRGHRFRNITGAFRVNEKEFLSGKAVLLIDDILTTGSTLNECARVLKAAGAQRVYGAVIASGRKNG